MGSDILWCSIVIRKNRQKRLLQNVEISYYERMMMIRVAKKYHLDENTRLKIEMEYHDSENYEVKIIK